mmetsp:Transcript_19759/g.3237  ORF Transcript_19759/g.3237 Transcript_19759/m.3237 type:complete len:89 (-) Transcript_19759:31-297(-)|eukprot:CAMPEP_0168313572 /NCGR_PEP_ID=MMETSP0210-20121227/2793_1 /TAXON_ID=40633 /ORGANISM="Condylostoma magnum, Strain COL2" /LENGTH=88 /DNA_ID=CAMNT_0008271699 /DNA_START=302 /DNA_END=568 /DNA_ORIENTATION=-
MPAWRGYNLGARATLSAVPFLLSMYRGYRRGYDQITYVGSAYMEHHLKRKALLEYLKDNDDFLPDFKRTLMEKGTFNMWLQYYGLDKQ